jgi:hypothetical protein
MLYIDDRRLSHLDARPHREVHHLAHPLSHRFPLGTVALVLVTLLLVLTTLVCNLLSARFGHVDCGLRSVLLKLATFMLVTVAMFLMVVIS